MYRGRLWTRRQIAGFGTARATNERYRFLLAHGQTGLSTDFDHPTLTGYDSDHELAEGEVGRLGVAIDTAADMGELFDGIPLDRASVSLTINHPAIVLLAMFLHTAQRRGTPWAALRGTVQNDSLKEFHGQKTFALPPGPALKLTTDVVEFCTKTCPTGTPYPSAATTPGRPGPMPFRNWRSPSPRGWPTWSRPAGAVCRWMLLLLACLTSLVFTTISLRRSPSSAPPGACGPG